MQSLVYKGSRSNAKGAEYKTIYAAAADVYADIGEVIPPGERRLISTGLFIQGEAQPHYFFRVYSRSGLAVKGIDVGAGIIDSDYQGEIKILLINNSKDIFQVEPGDRIAQMVMHDRHSILGIPTASLKRCGGFGSTGTNN